MTDQEQEDERFEQSLREGFQSLRTTDAAHTPPFAPMFAQAAAEAEVRPRALRPTAPRRGTAATTDRTPSWRSARTLAWATPMLVAAGLALVVLSPERRAQRAAEQEFEALVSEWTRTATQATQLPTDGLLSLPGSQYLRTMPAIGGGGDASGTRRPS